MNYYKVAFVKYEVDFFSGVNGVVDDVDIVVAARNRNEAREEAARILNITADYQWAFTSNEGEAP